MKEKRLFHRFIFISLFCSLFACGGGSDGADDNPGPNPEPQPEPPRALNYQGIVTQAPLDRVLIGDATDMYLGMLDLSSDLNNTGHGLISLLDQSIDIISDCSFGGTESIRSNNDKDTISIVLEYKDCKEINGTMNGALTFQFVRDEVGQVVSRSIIFNDFGISSSKTNLRMSGDVAITDLVKDTMLLNMVVEGGNKKLWKVEDLSIISVYSTPYLQGSWGGKIYDELKGYVEVNISDQFSYSDFDKHRPDLGGPLTISGLDNDVAIVSIFDSNSVKVEFDDNSSGNVRVAVLAWDHLVINTLTEDGGAIPIANAGELSQYQFDYTNIENAGEILLLAYTSSDPEHDLLEYKWSIVSSPEHSDAYLVDGDKIEAKIYPDRLGAYIISLEVYDGVKWSSPYNFQVVLNAYFGDPYEKYAPVLNWSGSQTFPGLVKSSLVKYTGFEYIIDASSSTTPLSFVKLSYSCVLTSKPADSIAAIVNVSEGVCSFIPDVPGRYEYVVSISDGSITIPYSHFIDVALYEDYFVPRINRIVGIPYGVVGDAIQFTGNKWPITNGVDADQFTWQIVTVPDGSALSGLSGNGIIFNLSPDVPGIYEIELTLSNGYETSNPVVYQVYVKGTKRFSEPVEYIVPNTLNGGFKALEIGDVDNDSYQDIVVTGNNDFSDYSDTAYILYQDSASIFSDVRQLNLGKNINKNIWIHDLDENGVSELLLGSNTELEIYNIQDRTIMNKVSSVSTSVFYYIYEKGWIAEHLNADSTLDLLWVWLGLDSYMTSHQSEIDSLGFTTTSATTISSIYPHLWDMVQYKDMNSDGLNDIVIFGNVDDLAIFAPITGYFVYFPQQADGSYGPQQTLNVDMSIHRVYGVRGFGFNSSPPVFEDLDNDGDLDIIAKTFREGVFIHSIAYWLQDDNNDFVFGGVIADTSFFTQGFGELYVEDLDGDGLKDVIIAGSSIKILYQDSNMKFNYGESYFCPQSKDTEFADIDKDGDTDIVCVGREYNVDHYDDKVIVFRNNTI